MLYPIRQSIALSNTLLRHYNYAKNSDDHQIVLDLSKSKSLTPFAIIMLTSTIFECHKQGKECTYRRPANRKLQSFFRDIGFNDFFGLDGKALPGDLIRTGRVLLRRCVGLDYMLIENISEIIDYNLNISPGVKGSLRMSLQETMTNVIDHSEVNDYLVCAYTYKRRKQIRLCIADLRVGIFDSLNKSPKYAGALNNDYYAIRKATENGVSSREARDGMGLNHIKQFIKVNQGQMCIISGRGKVYWKYDQSKILEQTMQTPFRGTIVKLIINIDKEGFYFLSNEEEYLF